jgi:hypothetical protein
VPLVEQELLTFLEHPSSLPVFSGVCLFLCNVLQMVVCPFFFWPLCCLVFFDKDYDYPFGIFKLFLQKEI